MAFSTKIIGWSKETGKVLYVKEQYTWMGLLATDGR